MSPRRLVLAASALLLAGACGACSSDDPPPAAAPALVSSSSTTPSTTSAPLGLPPSTTLSTAAIPGGCPSGVGVAAQSAQQAARCLFQAWEEGNRTTAAAFASLDVVDVLFRERWSPPTGTFSGCAAQAGTDGQICTVEHRGTRYLFDVRRSEGGWRVTQLRR